MSWRASAYVKKLTTAPNGKRISRSEKLLLLVIADYYNDSYRCAWPNVGDLVVEVMLSARRVRELQRSCEEKGVITIHERKLPNGSNDANEIRFPALEEDAETRRGGAAKTRRGVDAESHGEDAGSRRRGQRNGGDAYKEEPPDTPQGEHTPTRQGAGAPVSVSGSETSSPKKTGSRFTLGQCQTYAASVKQLHNPGGYATVIYRSGEADDLIEAFLQGKLDTDRCPDCKGRGMVYIDINDPTLGVGKCKHTNLQPTERKTA